MGLQGIRSGYSVQKDRAEEEPSILNTIHLQRYSTACFKVPHEEKKTCVRQTKFYNASPLQRPWRLKCVHEMFAHMSSRCLFYFLCPQHAIMCGTEVLTLNERWIMKLSINKMTIRIQYIKSFWRTPLEFRELVMGIFLYFLLCYLTKWLIAKFRNESVLNRIVS